LNSDKDDIIIGDNTRYTLWDGGETIGPVQRCFCKVWQGEL